MSAILSWRPRKDIYSQAILCINNSKNENFDISRVINTTANLVQFCSCLWCYVFVYDHVTAPSRTTSLYSKSTISPCINWAISDRKMWVIGSLDDNVFSQWRITIPLHLLHFSDHFDGNVASRFAAITFQTSLQWYSYAPGSIIPCELTTSWWYPPNRLLLWQSSNLSSIFDHSCCKTKRKPPFHPALGAYIDCHILKVISLMDRVPRGATWDWRCHQNLARRVVGLHRHARTSAYLETNAPFHPTKESQYRQSIYHRAISGAKAGRSVRMPANDPVESSLSWPYLASKIALVRRARYERKKDRFDFHFRFPEPTTHIMDAWCRRIVGIYFWMPSKQHMMWAHFR